MLKRKYRLKVGRLASPKTYNLNFFNAKVSDNNLSYPRISSVVSRKVDKKATSRNKLRRRMAQGSQEAIKEGLGGKDILFYPKKEALGATGSEVIRETREFLKKLFNQK